MEELRLIVDLHKDGERQGPGGEEETRRAIALSGLYEKERLKIADIGCGNGASTVILARDLDAHITAVDFIPEFLEKLAVNALNAGVADKIKAYAGVMEELPFREGELDAIWSEGAIYNMGFETGVSEWRKYLKPGGVLAVSELTWFTADRPKELTEYWENAYREVDTPSAKFAILEKHGYAPIGYFPLSERCWMDQYYDPLMYRLPELLENGESSDDAKGVLATEMREISLYERFNAYYGYGFYIARKVGD